MAYRASIVRNFENAKHSIQRNSVGMLVRRADPNDPVPKLRGFTSLVVFGPKSIDRIRGVWIREADRRRIKSDHSPYDDATVIPLVEYMPSLPDMTELSLEDCPVTSATMSHVGNLHFLTSLDISGTDIDDSAIDDIKKLSHLTYLDTSGSRISTEGLKHLMESFPDCEIH